VTNWSEVNILFDQGIQFIQGTKSTLGISIVVGHILLEKLQKFADKVRVLTCPKSLKLRNQILLQFKMHFEANIRS
jgi:hypothetical protein